MNNIKLSPQNHNRKDLKKFLNDTCVLDTIFRKKHSTINNLYKQYNNLYLDYKNDLQNNETENNEIILISDNLYRDLKKNNQNLYQHRLNVVDTIKNDNTLTPEDKKNISNYLLQMFKTNPSDNPDNCCLKPYYNNIEVNTTKQPDCKKISNDINVKKVNDTNKKVNDNNKKVNNTNEKVNDTSDIINDGVDVNTLDRAYIEKHNELMQMFKAYQILFKKVGDYKDEIDKYKKINFSKLISKDKMKQMLDDQKYIMNTVDKMQEKLVENNILKPEERIPVTPVVSHPNNLKMFNNKTKEQIDFILKKNIKNIPEDVKNKIKDILKKQGNIKQNTLNKEIVLLNKQK